MKTASLDGFLVVNKPAGITSRSAVDRAAAWFPRRTKLGHAGTLDPLATGVLVLGVGLGTRLIEYVQRMDKVYESEFRLGVTSDTDDADGNVQPVLDAVAPSEAAVRQALQSFIGTIAQAPPRFSAMHVEGKRAHELARQGQEVNLPPRDVRIDVIDLLHYAYPRLDVRVGCGKGTYIRSLARDLGRALGCGALVQTLHRSRIGVFTLADAVDLGGDASAARARLQPLAVAVAELPRLELPAEDIARLCQGQAVHRPISGLAPGAETAIFQSASRGDLMAIARVRPDGTLQPEKVLRP